MFLRVRLISFSQEDSLLPGCLRGRSCLYRISHHRYSSRYHVAFNHGGAVSKFHLSKLQEVFNSLGLEASEGTVGCSEILTHVEMLKSPFTDHVFEMVGEQCCQGPRSVARCSRSMDTHTSARARAHTHARTGFHGMTRGTEPDCAVMCNLIKTHTRTPPFLSHLIRSFPNNPPSWEDQCEWHRMTRKTVPDGLRGYVQFH